MPEIDGGYRYYQKNIGELEDELKLQAKRAAKSQEDYENRLNEKFKAANADRDRELEDTVKNVKESLQETNTRDRENSKAEINRIKAETYDRFGRSNGLEGAELKQQLEAESRAHQVTREQGKQQLDDAEKSLTDRHEEQLKKNAEDTSSRMSEMRDDLQEMYDERLEKVRKNYDEESGKARKSYDELNREKTQDANFERQRTMRAIEQTKDTYEHEMSQLKKANTINRDIRERAMVDQQERNERSSNSTHKSETRQLRDQLKELQDLEGRVAKDRGEARSQAVKDYEDEWRTRERLTHESYGREIDKLKQSEKETDTYFTHLHNEALKGKDSFYSNVIKNEALDNAQEKQDLTNIFERTYKESEVQHKRERGMDAKRREQQAYQAAETSSKALEEQAKAYQETMSRQKEADNEQIDRLQKALHDTQTSEKSDGISPAAEAAVRKSLSKEYEAVLNEERDRNKRSVDSIQREYANRVEDTVLDAQGKETIKNRNFASEKHQLTNEFLDHSRETQFSKDEALRSMNYDYERQKENLTRNFALMLERQRRDYESIITAMRDEASVKLGAVRQEHEFNSKMEHRASTARQTELIREYDKKLNEQKSAHQLEMEDLKQQTQNQLRDGERKTKQALEEQSRGFEQRIAQAEAQHKERERYVSENYQEELEKVRRSNALLIKKKS